MRSVSSTHSQFRVVTKAGIFSFSGAWRGAPELAHAIAKQSAPVEGYAARTRDWRAENDWPDHLGEWPHVFGYSMFENRFMPPMTLLVVPCYFAASWFGTRPGNLGELISGWKMMAATLPFFVTALVVLVLALFLVFLPFGMLFVMIVMARDGWRNERIVVTARGVLWQRGAEWRAARWDEISGYCTELVGRGIRLRQRVLDTSHGPIIWHNTIGNVRLMHALMATAAPSLFEQAQEQREQLDRLAPTGRMPDGTLIFHYRTRTNRAVLWVPTFMTLLPLLMWSLRKAVLSYPDDPGPSDTTTFLIGMAFLCGAAAIIGWCFYFGTKVYVSETGLEQRTPLGRRFVAWTEVREYYSSASEGYVVCSDNTRLRFSGFFPSDFVLLQNEIARRAINSSTHEWQRREASDKSSEHKRRSSV